MTDKEKQLREEICNNCDSDINGVCEHGVCDFRNRQIDLIKRKVKEAVEEVDWEYGQSGEPELNTREVLQKRGIKEND